jgi:hypothetical protein
VGDVRIVDEVSVSLIGADAEDHVYEAVVGAVHALEPDTYVAASALSSDGRYFRTVATAGLDGPLLGQMRRLLGEDPAAKRFALKDLRPQDLAGYQSGRIEQIEGGLYTLALGKFPKAACLAVERLLGISRIFAIGFSGHDLNYGCLLVAPTRGAELTKSEFIETLVHQATIALRRLRARPARDGRRGDAGRSRRQEAHSPG